MRLQPLLDMCRTLERHLSRLWLYTADNDFDFSLSSVSVEKC